MCSEMDVTMITTHTPRRTTIACRECKTSLFLNHCFSWMWFLSGMVKISNLNIVQVGYFFLDMVVRLLPYMGVFYYLPLKRDWPAIREYVYKLDDISIPSFMLAAEWCIILIVFRWDMGSIFCYALINFIYYFDFTVSSLGTFLCVHCEPGSRDV